MDMGIRELRAGLSRWLDPTRAGEELIITDRGAPVANLNPIDQHSFDRLVAAGLVTPLAHEPPADVPRRPEPARAANVVAIRSPTSAGDRVLPHLGLPQADHR